MKSLLTIKAGIILAVVAMVLTGAAIYAAHILFDVNVNANLQVVVSATDPIEIYSGDGVTPINSGDGLDFGVMEVDFFGRGNVPVRGPFFVKNVSSGPVRVIITGDLKDGIVPLFGPIRDTLRPAPGNAFTLQAPGSGDTMMGYLGLRLASPTAGSKSTTIIFRATEAPLDLARIAFSSVDSNYDIYVMDADGSNQSPLVTGTADDLLPEWSHDGSRIVFVSRRDGNGEVYVMDADGSNQTPLTNNAALDWSPHWSPNGTKIAFFSDRDINREIYVMNADGSNQTRLTISSADDVVPAWSPDGGSIVFTSNRDGNQEVYVMSADGSNQTRLTDNLARDIASDWSPDGSMIAFYSNRDGNTQIYVMSADGSNQTRLTNSPGIDWHPDWSPDGSKIAFDTNRDGNFEIYMINTDASSEIRLTNSPGRDCCPDWSPGVVPAVIVPAATASADKSPGRTGSVGSLIEAKDVLLGK